MTKKKSRQGEEIILDFSCSFEYTAYLSVNLMS